MYFQYRYVAIVSGLEIGSKEEQMFSFQLFLDMVTGQLGDVGQQQGSANIVGVVIAGNSLSKDTQDKDSLNKVGLEQENGLSSFTSIRNIAFLQTKAIRSPPFSIFLLFTHWFSPFLAHLSTKCSW